MACAPVTNRAERGDVIARAFRRSAVPAGGESSGAAEVGARPMDAQTGRQLQGAERGAQEITLRGLALGASITVLFMAANVYMVLKTGMTFSSSIPAAMLSMGLLRLFGDTS